MARLKSDPRNHHDWDEATLICRKCGIHQRNASSLVHGCNKANATRNTGLRPQKKPRKGLSE